MASKPQPRPLRAAPRSQSLRPRPIKDQGSWEKGLVTGLAGNAHNGRGAASGARKKGVLTTHDRTKHHDARTTGHARHRSQLRAPDGHRDVSKDVSEVGVCTPQT